jgi:hypothetical protein
MGFSPLNNKEKYLALAEIICDIILFWAEAHIISFVHYNGLKPVAS